jgi:hypothetical protein
MFFKILLCFNFNVISVHALHFSSQVIKCVLCMISGFLNGVNEICAPLGLHAEFYVEWYLLTTTLRYVNSQTSANLYRNAVLETNFRELSHILNLM